MSQGYGSMSDFITFCETIHDFDESIEKKKKICFKHCMSWKDNFFFLLEKYDDKQYYLDLIESCNVEL